MFMYLRCVCDVCRKESVWILALLRPPRGTHIIGREVSCLAEGAPSKVLGVAVCEPLNQTKLRLPVQVSHGLERSVTDN